MTNTTKAIERARKELDAYEYRYSNFSYSMQAGEHRVAAALYELLSIVEVSS